MRCVGEEYWLSQKIMNAILCLIVALQHVQLIVFHRS